MYVCVFVYSPLLNDVKNSLYSTTFIIGLNRFSIIQNKNSILTIMNWFPDVAPSPPRQSTKNTGSLI